MHWTKDRHDCVSLLRLLDVNIAYKHVQDAEATVVRGRLQEEQWRNLLGGELINGNT